jgi:hypothetical protein
LIVAELEKGDIRFAISIEIGHGCPRRIVSSGELPGNKELSFGGPTQRSEGKCAKDCQY